MDTAESWEPRIPKALIRALPVICWITVGLNPSICAKLWVPTALSNLVEDTKAETKPWRKKICYWAGWGQDFPHWRCVVLENRRMLLRGPQQRWGTPGCWTHPPVSRMNSQPPALCIFQALEEFVILWDAKSAQNADVFTIFKNEINWVQKQKISQSDWSFGPLQLTSLPFDHKGTSWLLCLLKFSLIPLPLLFPFFCFFVFFSDSQRAVPGLRPHEESSAPRKIFRQRNCLPVQRQIFEDTFPIRRGTSSLSQPREHAQHPNLPPWALL